MRIFGERTRKISVITIMYEMIPELHETTHRTTVEGDSIKVNDDTPSISAIRDVIGEIAPNINAHLYLPCYDYGSLVEIIVFEGALTKAKKLVKKLKLFPDISVSIVSSKDSLTVPVKERKAQEKFFCGKPPLYWGG